MSVRILITSGRKTAGNALKMVDSASFSESEPTSLIDSLIIQSKSKNPVLFPVIEMGNAIKFYLIFYFSRSEQCPQ